MNILKFFLIISLLNSCSSIDTSRIAPGYQGAFTAIKNGILGYKDEFITPQIIKEIPYASAKVR